MKKKNDSIPLPRLDGVRVLVLLGAIPLHGQERGNIEVFRVMSELGLKCLFITHREWGHQAVQPELTRLGLPWTTASFGPLMGKSILGRELLRMLYGVVQTNWVLWREVRRWRPTHFHCMNWLYVLYASPLLFLLRIPLTYRLGDCPPRSTVLHRWLWRLIRRRAAVMVCISEFVRNDLERSGASPRRTWVIYNRPPSRAAISCSSPTAVSQGTTRLVYVGQITAEKGVPILIEAVCLCLKRGRQIALHLAGDHRWRNPMAAEMIARLKADGFEGQIEFLGYQDNVAVLLRDSDLHVCPSVCHEALGNVVMEAKAEGIPSVVFPDGGLPEMIEHQVDGFICRDKTVDALVEGIEWFLDRPEEIKAAGRAARRNLEEKFGLERFQRQWAEVFLSTCRAARTGT